MKEIQSVTLEPSPNAAHYELTHQIVEFAEVCQAVTQHMAAELSALQRAVEHEGVLNGISLRSELTERLDITDRERDGEITGAKAIANALTKHPDSAIALAARQLLNEFISLKVNTKANYLQQTGQIDILLATLKGSYAEQLETCGLTKTIDFLQAANDRMHEMLNQRDLEQAEHTGPAMDEARRATDIAFRAFIKFYNAWILINASTLAHDDLGTTLFSTEANTKIEYFKRFVLKQNGTTRPEEVTPGEGEEEEESPTPTLPEEEGEEEDETPPLDPSEGVKVRFMGPDNREMYSVVLPVDGLLTEADYPEPPEGYHWNYTLDYINMCLPSKNAGDVFTVRVQANE